MRSEIGECVTPRLLTRHGVESRGCLNTYIDSAKRIREKEREKRKELWKEMRGEKREERRERKREGERERKRRWYMCSVTTDGERERQSEDDDGGKPLEDKGGKKGRERKRES